MVFVNVVWSCGECKAGEAVPYQMNRGGGTVNADGEYPVGISKFLSRPLAAPAINRNRDRSAGLRRDCSASGSFSIRNVWFILISTKGRNLLPRNTLKTQLVKISHLRSKWQNTSLSEVPLVNHCINPRAGAATWPRSRRRTALLRDGARIPLLVNILVPALCVGTDESAPEDKW